WRASESLYAASKAALNSFTEGLWNDLKGSNIHVALINPGPIDTEIWLKEDEPPTYNGKKYPPEIVTDAIFEAIEKRRYEMTIPKRNPMLITARLLRLLAPGVLRFGMAKTDPVPYDVIEKARARAQAGKRLGDTSERGERREEQEQSQGQASATSRPSCSYLLTPP